MSKLVTDDDGDGGSSRAHGGAVMTLLVVARGAVLLIDAEWFNVEVESSEGGERLFEGSREPDGPAIHRRTQRSLATTMRGRRNLGIVHSPNFRAGPSGSSSSRQHP